MRRTRILWCLLLLLPLSGCIVVSGGTKKTNPPTLGQQLIDLQRAHDEGVIDEAEYEDARRALLGRSSRLTSS